MRSVVVGSNFSPERIDDLVIAFNEVVTNAIVHGRGAIDVKVWSEPGTVVCTVDDEGTGLQDPLRGFVPPRPPRMSGGGLGLWITRQLCDEVDILPSSGGLKVRLLLRA